MHLIYKIKIEKKNKKIQMFDSSISIGKNYFDDSRWENYLIFKPVLRVVRRKSHNSCYISQYLLSKSYVYS